MAAVPCEDRLRQRATAGARMWHATRRQAKRWEPPQDATTRCKALTGSRDAAFDPTHAPWLLADSMHPCSNSLPPSPSQLTAPLARSPAHPQTTTAQRSSYTLSNLLSSDAIRE